MLVGGVEYHIHPPHFLSLKLQLFGHFTHSTPLNYFVVTKKQLKILP